MNVYVEATGRRIAPFDDPIGETLVQNKPLAEWQAEAFAGAGLTVIDELQAPCLVVPDTLLCNAEALTAFLEGAGGRSAVFVLKESRFGRSSTPVQPQVTRIEEGWRFEGIRFDAGDGADPVDVVVDPEEWTFDLPMPQGYSGTGKLEQGVPRRLVMTLHHWVHILWASMTVGGVALRTTPRWRLVARLVWAALRAASINKWKVLGKLNQVGKGCDIHPTAVVEGSVLGDGVVVGPFAHVAFSRLDDGAVVMPAAHVNFSVLGKGAVVADACVLRACVLYPGASASQLLMQLCVLGRDALTTKGGGSLDLNFDAEIKVVLDGRSHTTGLHFLGSAYGHRTRIGSGFFLGPGRTVPNDYFLIRDPKTILTVIPPGYEGQPLIASGLKAKPQMLLGRPRPKAPKA